MSINPAFDFVPSYPDDWEDRRHYIHERDGEHCQVTGCVNTNLLTVLDVHHIVPINTRPDHRMVNLVLMCRFHHAMLPDHGSLGESHDARYHLVPAHWRRLPRQTGRTPVKAHVQRSRSGRVTRESMAQLFAALDQRYAIECRHCRARSWDVKIRTDIHRVTVYCPGCQRAWCYERGLREEIGVQLFQTALRATTRPGSFPFPVEMLCVRPPVEPYVCEDCRALDRLSLFVKRVNGATGTRFLGCERFPRCRLTKSWTDGDENRVW